MHSLSGTLQRFYRELILMNDTEQLLLKIARCEVAQKLVGKAGIHHPCSTVVAEQKVSSWANSRFRNPGAVISRPRASSS